MVPGNLRTSTSETIPKIGEPRLGISQPGLMFFGRGTCKPNSVVCGHSSRRRVTADTHQRPTRRFRQLLKPPCRIGPMRSTTWLFRGASLPIWSCSVWGLPCPRHYYRSGALLPHLFTLTPALEFTQRRAYPASRANSGIAFPGRPSTVRPRGSRGGIFSVALAVHGFSDPRPGRYTAHCPAEFGLSSPGKHPSRDEAGSDRPVLLPVLSLPHFRFTSCGRGFKS